MELLTHLNDLAFTNRTVVLTIHQPRFEIFYMFNKLILLSDGKIAYSGVPQKAYGFFVEAVMSKFFDHGMLLPELENQNPAGALILKVYFQIPYIFGRCYHGYAWKAMDKRNNLRTISGINTKLLLILAISLFVFNYRVLVNLIQLNWQSITLE